MLNRGIKNIKMNVCVWDFWAGWIESASKKRNLVKVGLKEWSQFKCKMSNSYINATHKLKCWIVSISKFGNFQH